MRVTAANKNKKRKPDQVLVNEKDESHVRCCVREKCNALLINSLRKQPPHIGRGSECRLEPRITQLDILLLSYWISTMEKSDGSYALLWRVLIDLKIVVLGITTCTCGTQTEAKMDPPVIFACLELSLFRSFTAHISG